MTKYRIKKAVLADLAARPQICIYCGTTENLTNDHLIPFSKGGGNTKENLNKCCSSCNSIKSHLTLPEFHARILKHLFRITQRAYARINALDRARRRKNRSVPEILTAWDELNKARKKHTRFMRMKISVERLLN